MPPTRPTKIPDSIWALALLLFCILVYAPGIAALPVTDRDEGLFAETTKQMIDSGDYLHPRFEAHDAFTKPIGVYWAQAVSVLSVGRDKQYAIWPYRLPSLLAMLLAVAMTWRLGGLLFDNSVAILGAAILGTCPLAVIEAQIATTDAMLLASTTLAMFCLARVDLKVSAGEPVSRVHPIGFWLALGLGILFKGPVVPAVAAMTILTLVIWNRGVSSPSRLIRELRPGLGILLAAAICLPWIVAITMASDGLFLKTFWHEIATKFVHASQRHAGPPGYYFLASLITFWPASIVAPLAVWSAIRWRDRIDKSTQFCICWLVPAWIVLEVIPTKLPHYVLPMYPALALLTARAALAPLQEWRELISSTLGTTWLGLWLIASTLIAGAAFALLFMASGRSLPILIPAIAIPLVTVAMLAQARAGRVAKALWIGVVAAIAMYPILLSIALPAIDKLWLTDKVVSAVARNCSNPNWPMITIGYDEPSLQFASTRPVTAMGIRSATAYLKTHRDVIVLVDQEQEPWLKASAAAQGIQIREVWSAEGFNYTIAKSTRLALLVCDNR
ncbi:MAG TPA: glycosyltransferase family 39 protein [Candidatus Binataceae bacterium]|nr:glycosyltransferase family 39 protein [Candidatus Binataceae bacterium]